MDNDQVNLIVDQPEAGILQLTLERAGEVIDRQDLPYQGHVDNILLTAVDNLLRKNRIHRSALIAVQLGKGIDKNSSSYRIVKSYASAIAVASANRQVSKK